MLKKTFFVTLFVSILLSGAAAASPLTDYSAGKVAIDASYSKPTVINDEYVQGSFDRDGKGKWDFAGTFGLGNKFAIQYSQATLDVPIFVVASTKMDTKKFNVLYQLNPNVSVYSGLVRATTTWSYYSGGNYVDTRNIWQFGIEGHAKLADKLVGFASLGAGSGLETFNIGLGYEVAPNVEVNVGYGYNKIKDFTYINSTPGYKEDFTAKGMKYGVTFKF